MVHIDGKSRQLSQSPMLWEVALLVCLSLLPYPYLVVASLVGFLGLCLWQTYYRPKAMLGLLYRRGFLALSSLLVVSSIFAFNPSEAYLQLAHFLPFFWIWAAVVLYLRAAPNPWQQVGQWANVLVLTTVPINLVGMLEYFLKHGLPAGTFTVFPGIDWLYVGDFYHPRAFSLFDYPNTLANYLVMMLGLNIGLLFLQPEAGVLKRPCRWFRVLLYVNVLLTLLCLYCSGSRNGYLVAAFLILVSFFCVKSHAWVRSLGLAGLTLIVVTTLRFGIGGRSLSWAWVTDDPRVGVWGLAVQLAKVRPLLGHGLGNFKLLYNGEVPGYDFIAHAHNLWLMLASETGILSAIALTVIVGLICYRGCQGLRLHKGNPNHYAILLAFSLCFLGSVLFSLLDVAIFEVRVNCVGWLSLAVLFCSPDFSRGTQPALD